jgi:hypothetical protein
MFESHLAVAELSRSNVAATGRLSLTDDSDSAANGHTFGVEDT